MSHTPLWDEILAALALIEARPPIEGLVDGFLLVTPEQYEALVDYDREQWRREGCPNRERPNPIFGIPILIVELGHPATMPSGRIAVNAHGVIYVMPKPHLHPILRSMTC